MDMKIRKIWAIGIAMFAACMVILGMRVTVKAETYKGSCGEGINWTVDTETGVLELTGSGDGMLNWYLGGTGEGDPSPWHSYKKQVTTIMISDGITRIGNYAFSDCVNLTTVIMPDSITEIGKMAFYNSTSLKTIELSENLETLGDGVFKKSGMESIRFPQSLKTIGESAFYQCRSLVDVQMTEGLTTIGYSAFKLCDNLESIVMPQSVTTVGGEAFQYDYSLKSVVMSDSISEISPYTFSECSSLVRVHFPSNLKTIKNEAFWRCYKLRGIKLPEGLETIEWRAFRTTGVEHIIIPSTVKNIGGKVFEACDKLTKIAFLNPETSIGDGYFGVVGVSTVYGYEGSTASRMAINKGYAFEVITENNLWEDYEEEPNPFEDVEDGQFYYDPVQWAVRDGITTGYTETIFAPYDMCTRGQMVTFLWRTAGKPEATISDCTFKDVDSTAFYYDAMLWAVENGITTGYDAETFGPHDICTRAQVVTFLWRSAGKPEAIVSECKFEDVNSADFYYNAMLWAVKNGITTGKNETTFAPHDSCLRGEVVTFLYRAAK